LTWALGHTSPRLLPFVSVTHYNMDYYSITDPGGMEGGRMDEGGMEVSWLTGSGWRNHKAVTHPARYLAYDRESSPA